MSNLIPKFEAIASSYFRIKNYIHQTPIITNETINNLSGCQLYFKCENFQKCSSFKARGAVNAILQLSDAEKMLGVATHSSGNHGGALARMAKLFNIKAYVVMPQGSSQTKVNYAKAQGANVIHCGLTSQAREEALQQIINQTGAIKVHPYNDYQIITGQGTCAYEVLHQLNEFDSIITPVGGGGLLSGTCLTIKQTKPQIQVYAAEPYLARDAFLSLQSGEIHPQLPPVTIADGVRTNLGDKTFPIIKKFCDGILLVEEQEIIDAMNLIWKMMKIIVEPTSATVLAAVLKNKQQFKNKKIVLVLSGGNIDLEYKI